jgi:hypothetical protein
MKEECDPHRNLKLVPLRFAETERGLVQISIGHRAVLTLGRARAGEQQVARAAGALKFATLDIDDMRMAGTYRRGAQLT